MRFPIFTLILFAFGWNMSKQVVAETESTEAEDLKSDEKYLNGLQDNYMQAFGDVIAMFQNINSTIKAVYTKMAQIYAKIRDLSKELKDVKNLSLEKTKSLSMDLQNVKTLALETSRVIFDNFTQKCHMTVMPDKIGDFEKAEFYVDAHFYGKVFRMDNGDERNCFNVDNDYRKYGGHSFNEKISSVKPKGNCVRLYEQLGCTGETLELSHGVNKNCEEDLTECGWNDRVKSLSFCSFDPPPRYMSSKGSRGEDCKDKCDTRGENYFWCNLVEGSWDYCSPRPGQDYIGNFCDGECQFGGRNYQWCYTTGQRYLGIGNGDWEYCS